MEVKKFFALLDGVKSDLEDDIDKLMNDSDTEFVFEKEDSEKGDVSDYQPKNILIPKQTFTSLKIEGKIQRIVKKRVKKTEVMFLKQKKKGKVKEKGKEKAKKVEVPLNRQKRASPHPEKQRNLFAEVTHPFPDNHTPFFVFSVVKNFDSLLKLLVD